MMMNSLKNMSEFEETCNQAMSVEEGIVVFIKMPGLEGYEEIYNPPCNVKKKLEYYKETYNENLEMKRFSKIKIVGCYIKQK